MRFIWDRSKGLSGIEFWIGPRVLVLVQLSTTLWWNRLPGDEKRYSIASLCYHTRGDTPGVTVLSLIVLWACLRVGIDRGVK